MKILEIAPGLLPVPPVGFGAIERVVWNLYLALGKLGHQVMVYNQPRLDPHKLPKLKDTVVHCHWAGHAATLRRYGIPYAYTSHSHIWRKTCLDAINGSSVYLSLHENLIPDAFKTQAVIVGNGVNPENWYDVGLERKKTVVACGNYSDRKRLWWMYDLIEMLDEEWMGVIVGPSVPHFLEHKKHPRVVLRDAVNSNELMSLYNHATVGFHPAAEEAFALVPLEMAACGLQTYVAAESYVYGFPIVQFEELSTVAKMIKHGTLPLGPAKIASKTAENFSWDGVAKRVAHGLEMING